VSDEQHMSKYARKVAARLKAQQSAGEAVAAIDLAVRITNGEVKPQAPKPKKPKQPPPEPRGQIGELGDRPERLGKLLAEAAAILRAAETLAEETLALSKVGLQQAEPRSVHGFLVATAPKVEAMAYRATKILNAKGNNQ
jgi:hypothetical protein